MVREIRKEDYQLYMDLSREFYDSEAVLHPIPESYREETWKEMMRSPEFVRGYILEKDGAPVLQAAPSPRKPAGKSCGWKNFTSDRSTAATAWAKNSSAMWMRRSPRR